jgi:hypothetical protein
MLKTVCCCSLFECDYLISKQTHACAASEAEFTLKKVCLRMSDGVPSRTFQTKVTVGSWAPPVPVLWAAPTIEEGGRKLPKST